MGVLEVWPFNTTKRVRVVATQPTRELLMLFIHSAIRFARFISFINLFGPFLRSFIWFACCFVCSVVGSFVSPVEWAFDLLASLVSHGWTLWYLFQQCISVLFDWIFARCFYSCGSMSIFMLRWLRVVFSGRLDSYGIFYLISISWALIRLFRRSLIWYSRAVFIL